MYKVKIRRKKKKGFFQFFASVWLVFLIVVIVGVAIVDSLIYESCQEDEVESVAENLQQEISTELKDIKLKEAKAYAKNGFEEKESLTLEEETICKKWLYYDLQGTMGKYIVIEDMEGKEIYHTREAVYLFFNEKNSSKRQLGICTEKSIIQQIADLDGKKTVLQQLNAREDSGIYEMVCESAYFKGAKFYPEKIIIRNRETQEIKNEISFSLEDIDLKGYQKLENLSDTLLIWAEKEYHNRQKLTGEIYTEEKERDEEYLQQLQDFQGKAIENDPVYGNKLGNLKISWGEDGDWEDNNDNDKYKETTGCTYWFHNNIWEDEVLGKYIVVTEEGESYQVTAGKKISVLSYCINAIVLSWIIGAIFSILLALVVSAYFYCIYKKEVAIQRQQKMFSNALAHDLKTPLMAISGYADNVLEHTQPEKEKEYIIGIQENVRYMNDLIGQVLTLAKLEHGKSVNKTQIILGEVLNKHIQLYKDQISKKNLTIKITGDTVVLADSYILERLVKNLLDNAVRYATENTKIEVVLNEKDFSIANVSDTLSKEKIQEIWNPFARGEKSRTRTEKGGHGLGLSIVKEALYSCGWKGEMLYENGKVIVKVTMN